MMKPSHHKLWIAFVVVIAAAIVIFLVTRPSELPPEPVATAPGPLTTTPGPLTTDPKVAATELRLTRVKNALDAWLKRHMSYPELAELLVRDDYLRPADFDDAWGRRIDYNRIDSLHYRLCSRGPDNLPKTEDDVCLGGRP